MTTENQTQEKKQPVAYLTYLPDRQRGNSIRIGPLFATSREDCRSVLVESLPMRLLQDLQRGEMGSFFIWEAKDEDQPDFT